MATNDWKMLAAPPSQHKAQVRELQKAFKAAAVAAGLAKANCKTVCEQRVVIGPDGKPHMEWVCRVICS